MTIVELKKELSEALVSLNHGDIVTAERIEQWAAALDRTERDHPDPGSRLFSAPQLRTRAAKGDPASLKTEIAIVLAKLAHWRSVAGEAGQAADSCAHPGGSRSAGSSARRALGGRRPAPSQQRIQRTGRRSRPETTR
jgi:hypothetical protein